LHLQEINNLKSEFSKSCSKIRVNAAKQLSRRFGHSASRFNEWQHVPKK